jgi:hypothetical protein
VIEGSNLAAQSFGKGIYIERERESSGEATFLGITGCE